MLPIWTPLVLVEPLVVVELGSSQEMDLVGECLAESSQTYLSCHLPED